MRQVARCSRWTTIPALPGVAGFIRKTSLDELPTESSERLDGAALARLEYVAGHHWVVAGLDAPQRIELSDLQRLD